MKVRINNFDKPAPWLPSLIGGLFNLAGAGASIANQQGVNQQQMQHDKQMAGINQHNALEQMKVQNQYQVEQWNRENAYNDPSAVAARYRAAGISPHSALGGSASGAGIAGGLSSAPSGSSTGSSSGLSTSASSALSGLGSSAGLLVQSEMNKINRERMEADREKTYQEAKKVALENDEKEFMRDMGVWQSRAQTEKDKSTLFSANATMASIRALNYDRENRADIAQKEAAADEMRKKIEHYDALIERIDFLKPAEKEQLLALADKYREEARYQKTYNDFHDTFGMYPDQIGISQLPGQLIKVATTKLPQEVVKVLGSTFGLLKNVVDKVDFDKIVSDLTSYAESAKDVSSKSFQDAKNTLRATLHDYFDKKGKNIVKNGQINLPL